MNAVRWWERPRAEGRQGRIVKRADSGAPIECPQCGNAPIVYNGNYFCDGWGDILGECDWAMSSPPRGRVDRGICAALGIDPS